MLDPIPETRFTLKEILSHPWMTGSCKKVSPLLSYNESRQTVTCDSADSNCMELQIIHANDAEDMRRQSMCLESNTSISSVYGSYMESSYWENLTPINQSHLDHFDHEFSPIEGMYSSVPHKNSTDKMESKLAIVSKSNLHICSVQVKESLNKTEYCDEKENIYDEVNDDIIFV